MATNISNPFSFGKLGALVFTRQPRFLNAETHPSLFERLASWWERRSAEAELKSMSYRDLADIGVRRQDIHAAVRVHRAIR